MSGFGRIDDDEDEHKARPVEPPTGEAQRLHFYTELLAAHVDLCRRAGFVCEVVLVPEQPLAMGNYRHEVRLRPIVKRP